MDTLTLTQVVHDTLYIKGAEGIDVLNKTDAFYNNAWSKLLIFWTILAIIIPAVISWFQRQTIKWETKKLKDEIREEIENARDEVKAEIQKDFDKEMTKAQEKMNQIQNYTLAGIYFLQATSLLKEKQYARAFNNYLKSANAAVHSPNTRNLELCLLNIKTRCLPHLSKEELKKNAYIRGWENVLNKFNQTLSEKPQLEKFWEIADEINRMIDALPDTRSEI